jgi:uracil-DNA glycosylase family protein
MRKTERQRTDVEATQPLAVALDDVTIVELRAEAKTCRACPLWKLGTQTVFGEGPERAQIILIGEQPGDQEDLQGRPFVGPAGRILDKALDDAGLDRTRVYVTNAVKHFKYELRGKRRLHKSPNQREILACNRWLQGEVHAIAPKLIVAMGATAARAVFGRAVAIGENRGRVHVVEMTGTPSANVLVTVHPSFLLRMPPEDRASAYAAFVADLKIGVKFARR